jgi:hypothetical protein
MSYPSQIPQWQVKLLTCTELVRGLEAPKVPPAFVEMHRLAVEGERNRRMQKTQFQFDMERAFRRR